MSVSAERRRYTPEFQQQTAGLVIETGLPVPHVAAEIGVGEQMLGRGCASNPKRPQRVILARCWMLMNAQSWNACAVKGPNYVWTVRF